MLIFFNKELLSLTWALGNSDFTFSNSLLISKILEFKTLEIILFPDYVSSPQLFSGRAPDVHSTMFIQQLLNVLASSFSF